MSDFVMVLGTRNKKKRREMEYLLKDYPVQLKTLDEFPNSIDVEETGTTFAENACLKAVEQARLIKQWVLAEDSGLSVAALDGAPGVYSARFSGPDANDETNIDLLLEKLGDTPLEKRAGWYTSYMALADPEGNVRLECTDQCHGRILFERQGTGGFGYDPVFQIQEYGLTFGQLGDEVKSVLSHRARANRQFVPQLMSLIRQLD